MARTGYWNHNVHYQPVILGAVPPGCAQALDVGCGDGLLACLLAERCRDVTGIDRDERMITLARARAQEQRQEHGQEPEPALGHLTFVAADFLAFPKADESYDFVCANTSLHHMDFAAALTAMVRLLRPGGRLAVIGLARNGSITDYLADALGTPVNLFYKAIYREASSGAPVKDPDMTWSQVRATAARLLPGARYRRHLLWRYSLLWRKPA